MPIDKERPVHHEEDHQHASRRVHLQVARLGCQQGERQHGDCRMTEHVAESHARLTDGRPQEEIDGTAERHQAQHAQQLKDGNQQDEPRDGLHRHQTEHGYIGAATEDERLKIPIGSERMEEQLIEKHAHGQLIDMLPDGQQRSHHDVGALHHEIGHGIAQHRPGKTPPRFRDVHQIPRHQEEGGHVECIDDSFGIGIGVAYIDQMETNHEDDE